MNRPEYIYYRTMRKATEDDFISLDESSLILIIEDMLGLSDDTMDDIMGLVEEGRSPDMTEDEIVALDADRSNHLYEVGIYEKVLREALQDEAIDSEELSLLGDLGGIIGITEDERKTIYEKIQSYYKDEDRHKQHPRVRDRLTKLFTLEE